MASKDIVVAFDAYGTLLSTESIAAKLAEHFGQEKAQAIAAKWRLYQLEYTWRLNSMNQYEPFSTLTLRSLHHALKEAGESLEQPDIDALMSAYDSLSTFPDVGPALQDLASTPGIRAVVFSNGTKSMISNSVNKSPDLAPHAKVFEHLVVVEEVRKFKPAPEVYEHLARTVGKSKEEMGEMWLVSGNPFDVCGARAMGMQAAWVDRAGNGWQDRLVEGEKGRPTVVVRGLGEVVEAVRKHAGK
ncbi:haloacid dehalogenase, type II [Coniosporium apollinis CBS 100218]|uniref:Haloacid dehalogenase, type II n=1 Tax=Coniosporium apollinis (strain CBS 100218) TaxID=1168221 RepID=R7YTE1_CONA1|nr:haloacid dehalogenase, type II [Coniosporium apollinis CBS 100218]EON65197.1 haloacid dehalogenase, type II [Coniosporium apollinis CBS 100218]